MPTRNIITNQLSTQNLKVNVKNLTQGESVRVKVLADLGNGKYQGFVSGVKVSFTSQNPLKTGTSFFAKVSGQNGRIILIPQNQETENFGINNLKLLDGNESLLKLIKQLSLPQDNLSLHLLKQFIQLKLPLENQKINKFYNFAIKYKGKEKRLAEAISILKEKSLELDENQILEFLEIWDNDFENHQEEKKRSGKFPARPADARAQGAAQRRRTGKHDRRRAGAPAPQSGSARQTDCPDGRHGL